VPLPTGLESPRLFAVSSPKPGHVKSARYRGGAIHNSLFIQAGLVGENAQWKIEQRDKVLWIVHVQMRDALRVEFGG
jgi:hypothetical protein